MFWDYKTITSFPSSFCLVLFDRVLLERVGHNHFSQSWLWWKFYFQDLLVSEVFVEPISVLIPMQHSVLILHLNFNGLWICWLVLLKSWCKTINVFSSTHVRVRPLCWAAVMKLKPGMRVWNASKWLRVFWNSFCTVSTSLHVYKLYMFEREWEVGELA